MQYGVRSYERSILPRVDEYRRTRSFREFGQFCALPFLVFSLNEVKAVAYQIINVKKYSMKKLEKSSNYLMNRHARFTDRNKPTTNFYRLDALEVLDAGNTMGLGI